MSAPTPKRKMIHRLKRDRIRKFTKTSTKESILNRRKSIARKSNQLPSAEKKNPITPLAL